MVVTGDRRKYLVALVALDPAGVDALCTAAGIETSPIEELLQRDEIRRVVQGYIDEVNAGVPSYAQIKYFRFLPGELSVEHGEMTPSLKIKRRVVEKAYRDLVESMYQT